MTTDLKKLADALTVDDLMYLVIEYGVERYKAGSDDASTDPLRNLDAVAHENTAGAIYGRIKAAVDALASVAAAQRVPEDTVTVDAVAWDGFMEQYTQYADGNLKVPFSELRYSLSAVIESAHRAAAPPAPAAEPADGSAS